MIIEDDLLTHKEFLKKAILVTNTTATHIMDDSV